MLHYRDLRRRYFALDFLIMDFPLTSNQIQGKLILFISYGSSRPIDASIFYFGCVTRVPEHKRYVIRSLRNFNIVKCVV